MTDPAMPFVERHRIASQQPPHKSREFLGFRSEQEVKVVPHKRPGQAVGRGLLKQTGIPLEKGGPVGIIEKNILSFYPSHHDMLEDIQTIYASRSGHRKKHTIDVV